MATLLLLAVIYGVGWKLDKTGWWLVAKGVIGFGVIAVTVLRYGLPPEAGLALSLAFHPNLLISALLLRDTARIERGESTPPRT